MFSLLSRNYGSRHCLSIATRVCGSALREVSIIERATALNGFHLYDQLRRPVRRDQILVTVISQDRNGDIWFGGHDGIARYHGGQIKIFGEADGLPGSEVTSFLQTSSGAIWVGTNTGLAQLVDDKFVPLTWQQGGCCGHLFAHSTKITTALCGLELTTAACSDSQNNQIANINSANGLFSDGVFCILEDDDGWFWMNSNQGIYRVQAVMN